MAREFLILIYSPIASADVMLNTGLRFCRNPLNKMIFSEA